MLLINNLNIVFLLYSLYTIPNHFRDKHEIVGDVRGKGLMIGVELVQDKVSRSPLNPQLMADVYESCKDNGVLFGKGGRYGNVSLIFILCYEIL